MRLSQACGLRSEIVVEGSGGWEDREVKTDSSRRGGIEVGGLSGRSVKVPGELLHTASRRRKEGCGGGQPKEDGKERRGLVLCREEHPARCCSRVVHTNGRCGTQTEPARNWRSSDLVRCVELSKDMEVRIGARRAPHRFPCERATTAVSTVHSESTRRNDDTPDLNEPLNTNHRGGENLCPTALLTRQPCTKRAEARTERPRSERPLKNPPVNNAIPSTARRTQHITQAFTLSSGMHSQAHGLSWGAV